MSAIKSTRGTYHALGIFVFVSIFFGIVEISVRLFLFDHLREQPPVFAKDEALDQFEFHPDMKLMYRELHPKMPHPFFGFVPNEPPEGIEFLERNAKSLAREEAWIGIFGGSVAHNLFAYYQKPLKAPALPKMSRARFVNFALAAGRQPQAFAIASQAAPHLSLSLNLEGRNEILSGAFKSLPLYYPNKLVSSLYFKSFSQHQRMILLGDLIKRQNALVTQLKSAEPFFETLSFLTALRLRWVESRLAEIMIESEAEVVHSESHLQDPTIVERIRFWLQKSCQQQILLTSHGVPAAFLVQPIFGVGHSIDLYKQGFWDQSVLEKNQSLYTPVTQLPFADLRSAGLNIFDLTGIFRNISEPVYIDDCCHLNQKGYSTLMEHVDGIMSLPPQMLARSCDPRKLDAVLDAHFGK